MALGLEEQLLQQTMYGVIPPEGEKWEGISREGMKQLVSAICKTIERNNGVIEAQLRQAGVRI